MLTVVLLWTQGMNESNDMCGQHHIIIANLAQLKILSINLSGLGHNLWRWGGNEQAEIIISVYIIQEV